MARRTAALLAGLAITGGGLPLLSGSATAAFQEGVAFTAATLPTHQTNGVVWAAAEAGGLVFAGGTFSAVRPPGTPSGDPASVPRVNLVVLDGATGAPTACAPSFTGSTTPTVRALDVSPDGRTLYVGGSFSAVNGVARQHLAALDIASCTLVSSFVPKPSGVVRAIDSTGSAVYYGGGLVEVGGVARGYAAAAGAVGSAAPGSLLDWAPTFDKEVRALALRPDGSEVVVGGDFDTVGGQASHALAVVDPVAGAALHTYPGFIEQPSVVKEIAVDETGFYTGNEGTGFQRFDGRIALDWSTHAQRWRDTCLGATQALAVYERVLYSGSHAHDCYTMNEFPDGPRRHLLAQTVDAPTAKLPWFPQTNGGTGEALGPRDMVVSRGPAGDHLWVVGEFTSVNGVAQQGLTRFGRGSAQYAPTAPIPSVTSVVAGQARVAWRPSFDADDATLTYQVYRDGSTTPLYSTTAKAWFWARQQLTFVDTGLTPGASHSYKVTASDGTRTASATRRVTVAGADSAYTAQVLSDGANGLWRYAETSDVFFADTSAAGDGLTLAGAATTGVAGALTGETSTAVTLAGKSSTLYTEKRHPVPGAFSVETWFQTTTTAGGKLIGFGDKQVLRSRWFDRHVYMTDTGQLVFGVHNGSVRTLTTPAAYNDGQWHHVVATQGPSGMALYVDGARIATNSITTAGRVEGYWRVGGDNVGCRTTSCAGIVWPSAPTSDYFAGSLDETAVYATALPATAVQAHWTTATGRPPVDQAAPTAPSSVSVTVSGSTPTVSWAASTDDVAVSGYDVHRSTTSGFAVSAATRVGSATGTTYTDAALPDGTYYYRVVARDAAGNESTPSAQVSAVVSTAPAPPTEVLVSASADSYANEGAPSSNYGTSSSLASRGRSGYASYLRFVLPQAPSGKRLTAAALRFRTTGATDAGSAQTHSVSLAGDGWTETGLTWRNKPALGTALGTVSTATKPGTVYQTPLDASVVQGLAGTTQTVAVTGSSTAVTDSLWFWSRNHSTSGYRPLLVLTYS